MKRSLARKSALVFGPAVLALAIVILAVPWIRLTQTVDRAQLDACRQVANLWSRSVTPARAEGVWTTGEMFGEGVDTFDIEYISEAVWRERQGPFSRAATEHFDRGDLEHTDVRSGREARVYQLAKLLPAEKSATGRSGVVLVTLRSKTASSRLLVDRIYLAIAGLSAVTLSMVVLFVLLRRVILGPLRALRASAEAVRAGRLSARSPIRTGDEFEELADTFNSMLETLEEKQEQLRRMNQTLDLQLTELAERNMALYETARLKSEFVASVSHELRTPLNSIIGFAEILQEIAESDAGSDPEKTIASIDRRNRYLNNIVAAGRTLLEMINELLTMARLDAGTVELHISDMSIRETCEALVALISPLADRKRIDVRLEIIPPSGQRDLPLLRTDPQKLQQIVFNFLSNAVKFTPEGGRVILRAERALGGEGTERVRLSVHDTGPGIPENMQQAVFERFRQLDSGMDRQHTGTGLGLAIAKEFAELLQCELQLVSESGRGSMFAVVVPMRIEQPAKPGGDQKNDQRPVNP